MIQEWESTEAATRGFIVPPGEGGRIPTKPLGKEKANSANTGGLIAVHEAVLLPDEPGPPRHRHSNLAELFYVLEGEVLLQVGDRVRRAPAGTFAFSPIDTVHAFRAVGGAPARLLLMAMPPEPGERYFEDLEKLPADAGEREWEVFGREHGVEVVGPSLGESCDHLIQVHR
ncbi:MAG: cupin domain-containing protein [Chloroflexi bacterium]|nr:cupin domain-containing protein [Chloroflexota bacterium]